MTIEEKIYGNNESIKLLTADFRKLRPLSNLMMNCNIRKNPVRVVTNNHRMRLISPELQVENVSLLYNKFLAI